VSRDWNVETRNAECDNFNRDERSMRVDMIRVPRLLCIYLAVRDAASRPHGPWWSSDVAR
jgi:hypothetical protein